MHPQSGSPAAADGPASAEASVYAELLRSYIKSLPLLWLFVGVAGAIFAILGHLAIALAWTAASAVADYGMHRMYRRWRREAHRIPSSEGMARLSYWVLARSAWNLAAPAAVALTTRSPVDSVFLLLMCGGLLFVAVLQAVYSTRLFVMGCIPPVLGGLVSVWAIQTKAQDAALFGGLVWIVAVLVFIGMNAQEIHRRERAARAEKRRMIEELRAAVEDALRRKAEADAAREAARRAALAKSTFLATMSHEIRTPLDGVLGMAQALERSRLSTVQRGQLATLQTSAQMLMLVLNDILDLSELEVGALEIAQAPCDLRAMLAEMQSFWACTAEDKGLELTIRLDDGLPAHVMLDPSRVRQILFNLVGNALKFTEAGGVLVVVRAAVQAGSARLLLEVTDTGAGIAPEEQANIFEPFRQGEQDGVRRHAGAGMGLAICKQLSRLMDGDVTLSSRPGRGSTFRVSLPLTTAAGPEVGQAPSPLRAGSAQLSILAADDNPTNLLVLEQLLSGLGHSIWKARDGREALEALNAQPFDLVLMDIQMPEIGGVEVLQALRQAPGPNQHTPMIAVTADALSHGPARYVDLGFAAFVAKPLHVQALIQAMTAAMTNPEAPAGEGETAAG